MGGFFSNPKAATKAFSKKVNAYTKPRGLGNVMTASGQLNSPLNPVVAAQGGLKPGSAPKQYSLGAEPVAPKYGSIMSGGELAAPYKMTAEQAALGDSAVELGKRARETGPSAWAQLQTQKLGVEQTNALNDASQQAAGQNAQAQAQLAMRGGLGSGSRERLASGSAWNQMAASQGIRNQGMQNRLGIGISDQEQKNAMLGQAAGLETGLNQFNVGQKNTAAGMNVQNAIGDVRGQSDFDMQRYAQQMAERGATRNANAMLASAPKDPSAFKQLNDPFGWMKGIK